MVRTVACAIQTASQDHVAESRNGALIELLVGTVPGDGSDIRERYAPPRDTAAIRLLLGGRGTHLAQPGAADGSIGTVVLYVALE